MIKINNASIYEVDKIYDLNETDLLKMGFKCVDGFYYNPEHWIKYNTKDILEDNSFRNKNFFYYTQNYSFLAWSDEAEQWLVEIDPCFC